MQEDILILTQHGEKPFQSFETELPQQWPSTQVNFISLQQSNFSLHVEHMATHILSYTMPLQQMMWKL